MSLRLDTSETTFPQDQGATYKQHVDKDRELRKVHVCDIRQTGLPKVLDKQCKTVQTVQKPITK